ncbi:hypothetical protein AS29_001615 [Bacillus sp. SJS]|nr:hypothetical protein AS29_001615 [Bacillus sp. SJS]
MHWGVADLFTSDEYRDRLMGARRGIPKILNKFNQYDIHATWATVGFLFASSKKELQSYTPDLKPMYRNEKLSPYRLFNEIGNNEQEDPLHYAPSIIEHIKEYKNQEIGTHTFSHYYCLEKGQSRESFEADLMAAAKIASDKNVTLKSIVFPRNQFNEEYLMQCEKAGISSIRGTEDSWIYKPGTRCSESSLKRAIRLADAYINLTGSNTYLIEPFNGTDILNIKASRFLRPWNKKFSFLEPLKINRIKRSMTYAAKKKEVFHLWWHPHNFGFNQKENLQNLESILDHFKKLNKEYGMQSSNMGELAELISKRYEKAV